MDGETDIGNALMLNTISYGERPHNNMKYIGMWTDSVFHDAYIT